MPIKLIPPDPSRSAYYYGRGTHLGEFVNRSTRAVRAKLAKSIIKAWEREIENRIVSGTPAATRVSTTFTDAANSYMKAGGDRRPIGNLIAYFEHNTVDEITQTVLDEAALTMFPDHSAATRNREVYTPVSAVLKHAGVKTIFRRPKGARGRELSGWLWPEEAERLFTAARDIDAEFGALLVFLCYTGCRLSEALKLTCDELRLADAEALIRQTKNGDPRRVFLPPVIVAELGNHPRGLERKGERVFRYAKSGRLYTMLDDAATAAQVKMPDRQAFHLLRHTYASWMRRFAGADTQSLIATGAWRSAQSASRYAHSVVSEEARLAALLPTATTLKKR